MLGRGHRQLREVDALRETTAVHHSLGRVATVATTAEGLAAAISAVTQITSCTNVRI